MTNMSSFISGNTLRSVFDGKKYLKYYNIIPKSFPAGGEADCIMASLYQTCKDIGNNVECRAFYKALVHDKILNRALVDLFATMEMTTLALQALTSTLCTEEWADILCEAILDRGCDRECVEASKLGCSEAMKARLIARSKERLTREFAVQGVIDKVECYLAYQEGPVKGVLTLAKARCVGNVDASIEKSLDGVADLSITKEQASSLAMLMGSTVEVQAKQSISTRDTFDYVVLGRGSVRVESFKPVSLAAIS